MSGLKTGLVKLVGLSLVLQFFTLMSPYYMQWVVDEVLISFDKPLLMLLGRVDLCSIKNKRHVNKI
jgi:ATP-binding cassette subfamily B protein RaxB